AETVGRADEGRVMSVDRHFAREEAWMERTGDPDLVAHMAQHRRIAAQVHGFRTAFEENLDAIDIDPFLDFLADWLTGHILKRDMDCVPHIDAPATA
ncbi:MAG: hemerythrin domain-containing protein, partial [Rhodospirillaceae bacterium]